ncbi:HEAT repeat domain-containing protein [Saccharomonospora viridis]|uniref:HEAT repeat-containing protein n=1 Tax=Saccharomonospora viridis TaxID=1852 RepID=A0A837D5D4_9PSEU|nr:HEAT repeat domain-containing protein [Saccharomonospora viridis]KHF43039.1 hypothetical protein MINT15_32410 [Saccharomonospora viridis]SFO85895.1 hypothetical protein SAMN02982918_0533 [Saccharomonospora viridis]
MHNYDIDAFGMLDTPEPAQPPTPSEPTSEDEVVGASTPNPEGEYVPPTPPRQGEAAQRSSTNWVQGDNNNVAGGDINTEIGKSEINVFGSEIVQEFARAWKRERAGRGIQDPEALQRLADKYVAPDKLLESSEGDEEPAFQILKNRRILLLWAKERAGGQFAAACRLGYELSEHARQEGIPPLIVREELVDSDLDLKPGKLLVKNEPATVILDYRDAGEEEFQAVRRNLGDLGRQLPHYRSYLIVILPHGQERRFEENFPGRVHELGKPSSIAVLERHIGSEGLSGIQDDSAIMGKLEVLWPPAIARVADLVRERLTTGVDPVDIVRAALDDETVGRSDKLRAVIEEKQQDKDAEWLSLLLSSAVLEGASPQQIAAASDVLMKHNKINAVDEAVPILRATPFARLRRLEGEGWFDLGQRKLIPSGAGGEVVRHFWREHPDLQKPMRNWLIELPEKLCALEQEELERLADRAAELAAEGGAGLALNLAENWAKTKTGQESNGQRTSTAPADRARRSIAVRLLTTAAMDSALGRQVRNQLWRWSRDGSADLKLLTAEVCAGIGVAFPRNALTRLKHLANSDNETVREAVLRALRQLGDELGVPRFLRYLTEWFDKASPSRLAILTTAVSQVFAEQSTPVETAAAELFWRHAVTGMLPDDLRVMMSSWLHATARMDPDDRSSMLEPLVRATGRETRYIAYMQYASKPQLAALDVDYFPDEAIAEVTQQLWTRLDEIDPLWTEG